MGSSNCLNNSKGALSGYIIMLTGIEQMNSSRTVIGMHFGEKMSMSRGTDKNFPTSLLFYTDCSFFSSIILYYSFREPRNIPALSTFFGIHSSIISNIFHTSWRDFLPGRLTVSALNCQLYTNGLNFWRMARMCVQSF